MGGKIKVDLFEGMLFEISLTDAGSSARRGVSRAVRSSSKSELAKTLKGCCSSHSGLQLGHLNYANLAADA